MRRNKETCTGRVCERGKPLDHTIQSAKSNIPNHKVSQLLNCVNSGKVIGFLSDDTSLGNHIKLLNPVHSNHLNTYVQNLKSSPESVKRLVKILRDNPDFLLNGELIATKSVLQQVSCMFFDSIWKSSNKHIKKITFLYNLNKEFIDNEVKRSVPSSSLELMDSTFTDFAHSTDKDFSSTPVIEHEKENLRGATYESNEISPEDTESIRLEEGRQHGLKSILIGQMS